LGTGGNAFVLESAGQFASLKNSLQETALAAGYGYRLWKPDPQVSRQRRPGVFAKVGRAQVSHSWLMSLRMG
jgi:hypothetical protein